MANCALCGKKIGFMETPTKEFDDSEGRGVCYECHKDFGYKILPDMKDLALEGKSLEEIKNIIANKYASNRDGVEYLEAYVDSKFEDLRAIKKENLEQKKIDSQEILNAKIKEQMITTGYNFEGYRILEYKGVVSGETVIGTGLLSELFSSGSDLFGIESNSFSGKMRKVKESALLKLKAQSVIAGGNAIIGVDFDYINFSSNMIGVSANGTSVVVEKIEE